MRRLAALALLPLLAAAAPGEGDELLRRAHEAASRGEHARAVALYEKAELRATDPGLLTFNLAAAQYQLARQGDARALAAAEAGYRIAAARPGTRRAQALFGLANCLLLRGGQGVPDGLLLRQAIDLYTRCAREPGCEEQLAADARYNHGRARLLLLQVPPGREASPEEGAGSEDAPGEEKDDGKHGPGERPDGPGAMKPGGAASERGAGDGGEKKAGGPAGGGLPAQVVSDQPDGPDLPEAEAAALLKERSKRVVEDLLRHRRGMKRAAPAGARDW